MINDLPTENFVSVHSLVELDDAIKTMRQAGLAIDFICSSMFPAVPEWLVRDIARCYKPAASKEEQNKWLDEVFVFVFAKGSAGPIKITNEVKEFLSPCIDDHIADETAAIFEKAGLQ